MEKIQTEIIDVAICCYNSEKYIHEAIDSVIAQTYKYWNLIIINDGSTDSTDKIIKAYINSGLSIKYYKQENKRFASARQKALELAENDWIALLDHDDIWNPNKLKIQTDIIRKNPKVGIVFSNSEQIGVGGELVRLTLQPETYNSGLMVDPFEELFNYGCYIDSITAIINKNALMEIGGFNLTLKYLADYDVFIKIASSYNIYYENQLLAKWRIHSDQASQTMSESMIMENIVLFTEVIRKYQFSRKTKIQVQYILANWLIKQAKLEYKRGNKLLSFNNLLLMIWYYPINRGIILNLFRSTIKIISWPERRIYKAIKIVTSEIIEIFDQFMITGYPNSPLGTRIRRSYWSKRLKRNDLRLIGRGANIISEDSLKIGKNFALNDNAIIVNIHSHGCYIGDNVSISHGSYLQTSNHNIEDVKKSYLEEHTCKSVPYNNSLYSIVIEDDVWIGVYSIILSGAHIGKGSVISAGSVVSSYIPHYSIAVGNPARVIADRKKLAEFRKEKGREESDE